MSVERSFTPIHDGSNLRGSTPRRQRQGEGSMRSANRRTRILVGLGLVGALTLAACADGDSTSSMAGGPPKAPTPEAGSPAATDTPTETPGSDAGAAAPSTGSATPAGGDPSAAASPGAQAAGPKAKAGASASAPGAASPSSPSGGSGSSGPG